MLAALLFNAGLGVKTEELTRLLQKPFVLLCGVSCNLMIPLAFIVAVSFLMHIWHDQEEIQQILSVLLWSPRCPSLEHRRHGRKMPTEVLH
jgi:BASS family bile acid:Na+ symporter